MELQRGQGTKVRLTLDIEVESAMGLDEVDIGVVRDNARQLKFKPESTGFDCAPTPLLLEKVNSSPRNLFHKT